MKYLIKYTLKPQSYFKQMTGIGPAFGASQQTTPRFNTKKEAQSVINRFPTIAATCCDLEEVES